MDVDIATILEGLGASRKFADPEAPLAGRKMAAGGALPLPPDQIAQVLFCLTFDPEPEIAEKARDSLDNLPDTVLDVALTSPLHSALLAEMAERFREDGPRIENLEMTPAGSIEGVVLSKSDGKPIAGARVTFQDARSAAGGMSFRMNISPDGRLVESDEQGRFTLSGLSPGLVRVDAREERASQIIGA